MKEIQRLLVYSYLERGINELRHGDPHEGYAILGQAYSAASGVPALRDSLRSLLGAWDLGLPPRLGTTATCKQWPSARTARGSSLLVRSRRLGYGTRRRANRSASR